MWNVKNVHYIFSNAFHANNIVKISYSEHDIDTLDILIKKNLKKFPMQY